MKNINEISDENTKDLKIKRVTLKGEYGDGKNGAFVMKFKGDLFSIIVSDGAGWDHVSVSSEIKIPGWIVMNYIKDLFFEETETVIQIHPCKKNYINIHPNCLHLWRSQYQEIILPPMWCV